AANLMELSEKVKSSLDKRFEEMGLELCDFNFENVSLPAELEKAMDENARLGMFRRNVDVYTQMAQADALKEAAKNPGMAGSTIGAGIGLGIGAQMMRTMNSAAAPAAANGAAAPQTPQAPAGTKFCPECGEKVSATAKFCPGCGTRLNAANVCPKCGSPLVAGAKFCPECGEKLNG
ncbi:MAG: zinc-ribbon domain-containing protein, partial [Candidatus Gallimonas sp.]